MSDDMRDLYQQKVELWARNGRSNLAYNVTSTGIVGVFYMPQTCNMGLTALLPLQRKACRGFIRLKNPMALAGFEPVNLGTRIQQANHQTTEATHIAAGRIISMKNSGDTTGN
jgi:hypothetical protein